MQIHETWEAGVTIWGHGIMIGNEPEKFATLLTWSFV